MNVKSKFPKKKSALGINNWIKSKTAVTPKTWDVILKFFDLVVKGGNYYKYPIIGPLLKKFMMFTPPETSYTYGYLLNLNEDLADKSKSVVMPIDMMKKAVSEASYRAIMNKCICRDSNKCADYPQDLGCVFVGQGARVLVERKVGHEATLEECMAHIDRAASLGLIGHSLWIEVEQYIWGFRDEDMHRFLEFCFCCPCCCVGLGLARVATRDIQSRFRSVGWKSSINEACTGCDVCREVCPVQAISYNGTTWVVDETKCLGCGICAARCPASAIKLELKAPMKKDIKDYYAADGLKLEL